MRTELNKSKLDLQKAKDQVEKGQAQLDEAKEAIAAGAAAKAGAAVDKLYEYLKEARGQIPGPDPDPNPGEPPITVPGQKELEQLKKTLERLNATLDKLMQDLESGELKVGDRLPSERELSEQMHISRSMVHTGLEDLERMGFVRMEARRGNYIELSLIHI